MRIYFKDITINDISTISFEPFIKKTYCYSLLFSQEGIFKLQANTNKIQKQKYFDSKIHDELIDELNILLVEKDIEYEDGVFQIPFEHKIKKITEEHYKLREKSKLTMVIIKDDTSKIIDFYFLFDEDIDNIHNALFKEDILTFFSDIK
jgi:hypothetical protein